MNLPHVAASGDLAAFFQLETRSVIGKNGDGGDILSEPTVIVPWFSNLITDAGLDLLGTSGADNLTYCRLGTGTTAPSFADTTLVTQVASTNTPGVGGLTGGDVDGSYVYRRVSRRFNAGALTGRTLTELGMGATSAGPLFCRTLIKEAGGTPISITIPAGQVLDVIYELRCYFGAAQSIVNVTIDDVATEVTIRRHGALSVAIWASGFASGLGFGMFTKVLSTAGYGIWGLYPAETQPALGTTPGYGGQTALGTYTRNYVPGSHQVTWKINMGLTHANYPNGIGAVVLSAPHPNGYAIDLINGSWSWGFSPKINKTDSRIAEITIGFSWGRGTIP